MKKQVGQQLKKKLFADFLREVYNMCAKEGSSKQPLHHESTSDRKYFHLCPWWNKACPPASENRQTIQPVFTHRSFEGKTSILKQLCNGSGLEIWAPEQSGQCIFYFLTGYAYRNTQVWPETGGSVAEISKKFMYADLPNEKRLFSEGWRGSCTILCFHSHATGELMKP